MPPIMIAPVVSPAPVAPAEPVAAPAHPLAERALVAPPMADVLADLLSYVRAVAQAEHSFHWRTRGPAFYGDHLMFERIYGGTASDVDPIAEKLLGLTNSQDSLCPATLAAKTAQVLADMNLSNDPKVFPADALRIEKALIDLITATIQVCGDQMTDGLENFLQGMADKHEGHVYLLQQAVQ